MESFVRALVTLVRRTSFKGADRTTPRAIETDLRGAPPCVVELVEALASHHYHIDLGEYSLFESGAGGSVRSIAPMLAFACDEGGIDLDTIRESGGPGDTPFDPNRTVELGSDSGGATTLALSWSGGVLGLVVVEYEDPTADNVLTHLSTPEAFFAFLDDKNASGDEEPLDVEALRAAVGLAPSKDRATPPAPTSGSRLWDGDAPAHPWALAATHFPGTKQLLQAGPTAAGRHVLVRRFAAGTPPTPNAIVVLGPSGIERTIEWPVPREAYGMCLVPGAERVLVSTGAPGPLVEIDLETGRERERLPNVTWSPGFLDAQHFAVLGTGEIRVYRFSDEELGAPVATMPCDSFNMLAAHGRVFVKTRNFTKSEFRVLALRDGELVEEGVFAIDAKVFGLHAATVKDEHQLVASVGGDGKVTWLVYETPRS